MSSQKLQNKIAKSFDLSLSRMRKIIKDFHYEMAKGLAGSKSSLKMIPAYVDRPTGEEKGLFMALDVGGTNFRILELELKGNGVSRISRVKKVALDRNYFKSTSEKFFDYLADCIKPFIKRGGADRRDRIYLGYTFSFPVEQTGIASGVLLRWTKGFVIKGAIGKDVVELLNEAFARKGIDNIEVAALANDTVGTLAAKSYEDPDCDVASILGTGTNACYTEKLDCITKWRGPQSPGGRMIINIEWGNFNKLKLTKYDRRLDDLSENPGQQILEKIVSGMYLGELARLVLKDLISKKILFEGRSRAAFDKRQNFKTEYMSVIEGDRSANLAHIRSLLKRLGVPKSTFNDRKVIKKICSIVSLRGARVSAAAIAAVITKMDPDLSRRHTIAIDGSVYEKHPYFSKNMKEALKGLFGKKSSRLKLSLAKDGSGKGAAIIAALAASHN